MAPEYATSGPLFHPRLNPRSEKLAERAMDVSTMYRILQGYLTLLPQSIVYGGEE